ncbi:PQ-loop repeat-containing protein [Candidatus Saccharibacteria bacterium]|nr:PQ-loop repeat-containing protein [Candidatus Saccharibacteria bacterium]
MEPENIVNSLGFIGAVIGGYAYLPQIRHLVRERCSAGISPRAFSLWTLSSLLVLINALYLRASVFIFICLIQLTASITILLFSLKTKGQVCASHMKIIDQVVQGGS